MGAKSKLNRGKKRQNASKNELPDMTPENTQGRTRVNLSVSPFTREYLAFTGNASEYVELKTMADNCILRVAVQKLREEYDWSDQELWDFSTYFLCFGQFPVWHLPSDLDLNAFEDGARYLCELPEHLVGLDAKHFQDGVDPIAQKTLLWIFLREVSCWKRMDRDPAEFELR